MKRTRNRASLPACFSLLQIASPSKPLRASPILCSSGNTIVRQSPPTPKLLNKNPGSSVYPSPTIVPLSSLHETPRGRRQEASRRSETPSPSRSRSRRRHIQSRKDFAAELSPKQVFDWSTYLAGLASRGRPTVRRDHSPISRVISEVEDAMNTELRRSGGADRQSRTHPQPRGRARVEDLNGSSTHAPGYGNGRSGLVSRERAHPVRIPL